VNPADAKKNVINILRNVAILRMDDRGSFAVDHPTAQRGEWNFRTKRASA
jgi:hypothetical protein